MGEMYLEDVMSRLDGISHRLGKLTAAVEKLVEQTDRMALVVQAGYVLTGDEVTEALARTERDTTAHTSLHAVRPSMSAIIFGGNGRELSGASPTDADYPLLATCVCGRQICCIRKGADWEYCGA